MDSLLIWLQSLLLELEQMLFDQIFIKIHL